MEERAESILDREYSEAMCEKENVGTRKGEKLGLLQNKKGEKFQLEVNK